MVRTIRTQHSDAQRTLHDATGRRVKIATYNVNGVNGRLPVLLRWLVEAQPDIVCLQELKAPDARFPDGPIRDLGYDAI